MPFDISTHLISSENDSKLIGSIGHSFSSGVNPDYVSMLKFVLCLIQVCYLDKPITSELKLLT